ncbi:hypothetical protein P9292_21965 [Caballeronia sp. LZ001]|nr:hypothetical protein [Caballeronia sp. LZ001]MDR5802722.1 hypothetical protein [Caballeronia sp. LZ001]
MPPRRLHHHIAPADTRFQHQARRADGAIVEQRLHEPVDRIAPEIFRDREHAPGIPRRIHDPAAL